MTANAELVLLTGASGFIAKHVALKLLARGYRVRGTVRSPAKAERLRRSLEAAGADVCRLDLVEADLTSDRGWDEAAAGCRYVIHTASPFPMAQPADKHALVPVARDGAVRVTRAAQRAGVERLVFTSSVVAVYSGHDGHGPEYGEADFSDPDGDRISAYAVSKTLAERAVWATVAGSSLELAVINPSLVLGPVLDQEFGTSIAVIRAMMKGRFPLVPDLSFGIVDVRDVAEAHVRAMEEPRAKGRRFLLSGGTRGLIELGQALGMQFPRYRRRMPRASLPNALVRGLACVLPQARAIVGDLGRRPIFDTEPARAVLGLDFIGAEEAAAATAESLIDRGLI